FATTKQFLDDLGLASLEQLPLLDGSAQGAAMLSESLPDQPSLIDPQAALALDEAAPATEEPPLPSEPAADAAPMEPQA
ncbi:MAG TPA: SMC-Scp complex subunit ScpB, partial [Albitalea sp.]|nr:SMC-Scp complex subunit ScpB [Albitalea sp.]